MTPRLRRPSKLGGSVEIARGVEDEASVGAAAVGKIEAVEDAKGLGGSGGNEQCECERLTTKFHLGSPWGLKNDTNCTSCPGSPRCARVSCACAPHNSSGVVTCRLPVASLPGMTSFWECERQECGRRANSTQNFHSFPAHGDNHLRRSQSNRRKRTTIINAIHCGD